MSILYRGSSIDVSYPNRFVWPSGFREEDFLEIDQSETGIACGAMFVNESGRNEQSL
jgi:hypothetical protein